jgi:hypothetical protein
MVANLCRIASFIELFARNSSARTVSYSDTCRRSGIISVQTWFGVCGILARNSFRELARLNLALSLCAGDKVLAECPPDALATCLSGLGSLSAVNDFGHEVVKKTVLQLRSVVLTIGREDIEHLGVFECRRLVLHVARNKK